MELLTTKLAARSYGRSAVRARPTRTGGARFDRHAPSQVRSSVRARGGSGRPGAVTSAARRITTATPPPGAPHAARQLPARPGPTDPWRLQIWEFPATACRKLAQPLRRRGAGARQRPVAPGRCKICTVTDEGWG